MPQFYLKVNTDIAQHVRLDGADSHHVAKVLRWKAGRAVRVVSPDGGVFNARISVVDEQGVEVEIESPADDVALLPRLDVAQAVIALPAMDDVVKAASESGVRTLIPFFSSRSTAVSVSRFKQRVERLERVVVSAAKQSGRTQMLEIGGIADFDSLGTLIAGYDVCVFGSLCADGAQNRVLRDRFCGLENPSVLVLVGPEGGFTGQEQEQFEHWGALPISLGPVTLRAENAVTAAASVINWQLSLL